MDELTLKGITQVMKSFDISFVQGQKIFKVKCYLNAPYQWIEHLRAYFLKLICSWELPQLLGEKLVPRKNIWKQG